MTITDSDLEASAQTALKHKPMFLLHYSAYDGPYTGNTDCKFISIGWAQYDQRSASIKYLRHTGDKWSRQSEEVPLHRAIDGVIFLCSAISSLLDGSHGYHLNTVHIPQGVFDNQNNGLAIQAGIESPDAFAREISDDLVLRRLKKLRTVLNNLHETGILKDG